MTKTAKQLEQDLIDHACAQLKKIARQHVREGMTPASAASAAIRETKDLFPPDWRLAVQGGGDEDVVEVWEVEHKLPVPCARVVRESEEEARMRLVSAVKERARTDADPAVRRIARWSNAKLLDILTVEMPDTEHAAFSAVVSRLSKRRAHANKRRDAVEAVEGLVIPADSRRALNRFWRAHPALRKGCLRKYGYDPIDEEEHYWRFGLAEPDHEDLLRAVRRNDGVFSRALVKRWEAEELKHASR